MLTRSVLYYGVIVSVLVTPFDKLLSVNLGSIPITLSSLSAATVAIFLIVEGFSNYPGLYITKYSYLPITLSVIIIAFDLATPLFVGGGSIFFLKYSLYLALFVASSVLTLQSRTFVEQFLWVLAFIVLVSFVLSISQLYGVSIWDKTLLKSRNLLGLSIPRVKGLPIAFGLYGILHIILFPFLLSSLFTGKGFLKSKVLTFILLVLCIISILLSQSKSTWLASGAQVICLLLLYFFLGTSLFLRSLSILTLLLTLFAAYLFVQNFTLAPKDFSLIARFEQLRLAFKIISDNFITGIGHGQFSGVFLNSASLQKWSEGSQLLHNFFLRRAVSTGFFSMLILVCLFIHPIFVFVKYILGKNKKNVLFISSLITGLIGVIIELNFYPATSGVKVVWVYLAIVYSYIAVIRQY